MKKKAIALSFAFYRRDFTAEQISNACLMAGNVVNHLLQHKWDPSIGVYNVNVPVGDDKEVPIHVTNIHTNKHCSLFKLIPSPTIVPAATDDGGLLEMAVRSALEPDHGERFSFSAEKALVNPAQPVRGSDAWAVNNRFISITPLKALFGIVEGLDLQLDTMKSVF